MPIKAVNIPSLMCCLQKECRPSCVPDRRVTKSDVSVRMPKTKHADNGVDSLPLYPRFAQSYVCHRRSLRQGSSRRTCPHGRGGWECGQLCLAIPATFTPLVLNAISDFGPSITNRRSPEIARLSCEKPRWSNGCIPLGDYQKLLSRRGEDLLPKTYRRHLQVALFVHF